MSQLSEIPDAWFDLFEHIDGLYVADRYVVLGGPEDDEASLESLHASAVDVIEALHTLA